MKTFNVKVYTSSGNYITTWEKIVASDVSFNNEINSAGGQMTITLARNAGDYGEGTDVDFNYRVKVYCYDIDEPNGILIFQGFISSYTPIYKDNKVDIVLLNDGSTLNEMISESGETSSIGQTNKASSWPLGNWGSPYNIRSLAQIVKATDDELWNRCELSIGTVSPYTNVSMTLEVYAYETDINYSIDGIKLASATGTATSTTSKVISFNFNDNVVVTNGSYYVLYLTTTDEYYIGSDHYPCYANINGAPNDPYTDGNLWIGTNDLYVGFDTVWTESTTTDLYFQMYKTSGDTATSYNSYDPSDILKAIIEDYHNRGGQIYYDDDSIDDTGTVVSYTFNTNTVLEAINKCLELAPVGWYWYIDYGTNLLHFHAKSNTPDHVFSLEKDLVDAQFEKRIEDVVNKVYFTGGDLGGGVYLYKKYTTPDSITKYGEKAVKIVDQRVIVEATADTMANTILEAKSEPELRVTLEVIDNNGNNSLGYDIESVKVGDVVAVRNITQQVGLSSWDVARWDEAYWDFNIYNLSSLQMQVQKLTYSPDKLIIEASTLPVDVNKRIEDINRNLEAMQTLNNPTAPS